MKMYKGYIIERLPITGYYKSYINDRFYMTDTLQGIKNIINEYEFLSKIVYD